MRERAAVCQFELIGNTVLSAEELAVVTALYTDRTRTAEEL
jgi:hemolysin activation/secretion protein